ncbi:MAG: hypothetical protein QWI36_04975 [Wolbachia endosymbiont of Tyrophagus putrescentiae]|nr:hypothetical protein [Wolbachia endosymbiont of Tyrophagus putrescentiae]
MYNRNKQQEKLKRQEELKGTTTDVQNAIDMPAKKVSSSEDSIILSSESISQQEQHAEENKLHNNTSVGNLISILQPIEELNNQQNVEEEQTDTLSTTSVLPANDPQNVQEVEEEQTDTLPIANSILEQKEEHFKPQSENNNTEPKVQEVEISSSNDTNVPLITHFTDEQKPTEDTTNAPLVAVTTAIVTMCILSLLTTIAISIASGIVVGCVAGIISSNLNSVEYSGLQEQHGK